MGADCNEEAEPKADANTSLDETKNEMKQLMGKSSQLETALGENQQELAKLDEEMKMLCMRGAMKANF